MWLAKCPALEPSEFIARIAEENLAFYSDERGRGALRDLQQTFPHAWLYVAELLQNAIDVGADHIRVLPCEDALVFEHNGRVFEAKDVEALSRKGVSTKGAATVGFMGIGFKSIFHAFEHVEISSGPWRFA